MKANSIVLFMILLAINANKIFKNVEMTNFQWTKYVNLEINHANTKLECASFCIHALIVSKNLQKKKSKIHEIYFFFSVNFSLLKLKNVTLLN